MANLFDLLQSQLSENLVNQVGKQFGIDSENQADNAIKDIFGSMMTAMAKNSQTQQGAESLNNALDRDHDGSLLSNVMDVLSGNTQGMNSSATNGVGILNHVFGANALNVGQEISKNTGLDMGKVMSMMVQFAPLVLSMLGKYKRDNNIDANALPKVLTKSAGAYGVEQKGSKNILNVLLDQDNDGSIIDDIAGKVLGGLFK